MGYKITHNKNASKFFTINEGKESVLEYIMVNSKTINMIHTYVPVEMRGRQIAASLVEAGLEYAEENNLKVIPSCSYVRTYINGNEKYKKLIA